jgi:hypothetical protein
MQGLVAMFGAELLLPIQEAVAAGMNPVKLTGASLFTGSMREETAALAETIVPATDTPGARDAGVAEFVEFMLEFWYPPADRDRFLDGMARLGRFCDAEYRNPFSRLGANEQIAVVTGLMEGANPEFEDGGRMFFEHAKQLTVFGYYTSEIGMTVERRYLPVPGRYDGAYPYEKVGTLFTS